MPQMTAAARQEFDAVYQGCNGAAGATVDGDPGQTQATSTSGGGGGAAGRIRINS
jgi:hypothetical protein